MEGAAGGLHKRIGVPGGRTLPDGVEKRGRLGCLLRAPGAELLPCLFASFKRTNYRTAPFPSSGPLLLFLGSPWVGNRAAFSDSRSNFHTRVGYRTNVCRRRLASDSARASEGTPAQGALEDHHDLLPGSPPEEVEQLKLKLSSALSSPGRWPR